MGGAFVLAIVLFKAPCHEMEGNQMLRVVNKFDNQFPRRDSDSGEFAYHIWLISNQSSYNNRVSVCAMNILFLFSPRLQKKALRRRLNLYFLGKMVGQEVKYIVSRWMEMQPSDPLCG